MDGHESLNRLDFDDDDGLLDDHVDAVAGVELGASVGDG
jgi:hypothetical protein